MTTTETITATENEDVFTRVMTTLVELAKHEGDFMLHDAIRRADIDIDEDTFFGMVGGHRQSAAQCVRLLRRCGAITSEAVYDLASSVERLALRLARDEWLRDMPLPLKSLAFYQDEATAKRESYLVNQKEKQYRFSVYVTGRVEYPEDDPMQGTYITDGTFLLGKAQTVADALERAKEAAMRGEWNERGEEEDSYDPWMCRDCGPVSFSEKTIEIRDEKNRQVLAGNACNMEWYGHVASLDEIHRIREEQQALYEEARKESGWDNYETARQLRQKADLLTAGIVDECWHNHPDVIKAVREFHYPAFMDEEAIAFNADEDMGIA
ncbi:Hok/Gef family protein [Klebsiella pneumoniae]|uniref:Hok/Gef family protein n=1 Tax=Klebsiella TaxID=570 RepID=UPI0015DC1AF1|nr:MULTISPECIES: Hok/Gef family protein [Klebsiella]HDT5898974.1 Hok/Gef family protein [Raoultella ornithinolytica]MBD7346149.1 Hok/Gef family protein [Klebsiella pneumoniae]MBD7356862.1 Hok/Gef family protein [Klebsiella pneumoniae]MBD7367493.1 Hok/Gef family protein [Klebsiella pneumoniae]MBD7373004.1 Hok/Gef family protein [Klebsiella pneumoniae]